MNFLFFSFLTTAVVTAAPYLAIESGKHQHKSGKPGNSTNHECHPKSKEIDLRHLREIITNVKTLKKNLTEKTRQTHVQNVFKTEECNCEMFCNAGRALSACNASILGLQSERDWRLPRWLLAYSKSCTNTGEFHLEIIPLGDLLDKIHICAQKTYANYK